MLELHFSTKYRKDYKRLKKRGFNVSLLDEAILLLQAGKPLPPQYRDHALTGDYAGHRECHIAPDWLLIYAINDRELILTAVRTGSHSDLF